MPFCSTRAGRACCGHDDARDYRETLRGVNDGRSRVQLNDVVFVRAEEAASHHAGAEGGAVTGAVEAIFFEAGGGASASPAPTAARDVLRRGGGHAPGMRVRTRCRKSRNASVDRGGAFYGASRGLSPRSRRRRRSSVETRFDVASDKCTAPVRVLRRLRKNETKNVQNVLRCRTPPSPVARCGRTRRVPPGRARPDRAVSPPPPRRRRAHRGVDVRGGVQNRRARRRPARPRSRVWYPPRGYGGTSRATPTAQFNEKGTKPVFGVFVAATFSAAASARCVLLASLGLGIAGSASGTPSRSKRRHSRSRTSRVRSCWNSTRNALIRVLQTFCKNASGAAADAPARREARVVALPVAALDAAFATLVLSALTKTLAKLEARRQHAKLFINSSPKR